MGTEAVVLAPRLETAAVQALVGTLVTGETAVVVTLTAQPVLAVAVAAEELMVLSADVFVGAVAVAAAWVFSGKVPTVLEDLVQVLPLQQVAAAVLEAQVGPIHPPNQA
jgi:hypothetical protein